MTRRHGPWAVALGLFLLAACNRGAQPESTRATGYVEATEVLSLIHI